MTYHNLQAIFDSKKETLAKISRLAERLSDEQAHLRPADGAWSVSDILEHLSIVDGNIVRLIGILTAKTEQAGKKSDGNFEVSLEAFVERSRREKYVAQETALPTGTKSPEDSLSLMTESQSNLFLLKPRFEAIDCSFASAPHRVFGTLTLGQWIAFIGFHEERHHGQMERVVGGISES